LRKLKKSEAKDDEVIKAVKEGKIYVLRDDKLRLEII